MKRIAREFLILTVLALAAAFGLLLMAPPARAQVTEAPPTCNPLIDGVGHVFGQVDGAEGVHWWCPPADDFADWAPARAARLTGTGPVIRVGSAADVPALVGARTVDTRSPVFAPLWQSMAQRVAESKPEPRWRVAPIASGSRQAYRVTDAGTLADMGTYRIAVGSPCNCLARVSSGTSQYCQAGLVPQIVALCSKAP